jgi:hypothetical protein
MQYLVAIGREKVAVMQEVSEQMWQQIGVNCFQKIWDMGE